MDESLGRGRGQGAASLLSQPSCPCSSAEALSFPAQSCWRFLSGSSYPGSKELPLSQLGGKTARLRALSLLPELHSLEWMGYPCLTNPTPTVSELGLALILCPSVMVFVCREVPPPLLTGTTAPSWG